MPALQVYSRQGCHLCEVLIEELLPMVRGVIDVEVRDIDTRADWLKKYDIRVPLVEFEGEPVCKYRLDHRAISEILNTLARNRG